MRRETSSGEAKIMQQMKVECIMTCLQYQIFRCDTLNKKKENQKLTPGPAVSHGEGGAVPLSWSMEHELELPHIVPSLASLYV